MSQTIKIPNFRSPNLVEKTTLTADVAAGSASLTVDNTNGLAANDLLYFGTLGSETGEVKTIQTVTPPESVGLAANLDFKHQANEAVTKLFGDQLKVYRAPNVSGIAPADNAFSLFTGSTVNIDYDQLETSFNDPAGSSDYWYKFTYYNSTTLAETSLADSVATRGGGYGNYCSLDDIREQAGFTRARYITDDMIESQRQAAQALINGRLAGKYTVPFTGQINPLVASMTKRLAGGMLLMEQYNQNSASYQNGEKMVAEITNDKNLGILDRLADGRAVLLDTAGAPISNSPDSTGFSGSPNDATTDQNGYGDRLFRITDIQGYNNRNY